ncbi:MAG: DUF1800 domain-containing protein [Fuerstiella sp.]
MNSANFSNAEWAWQPWQPTAEDPWSKQKAAHLLRRATFGAAQNQLQAATKSTPNQVVKKLLEDCTESAEYQQQMQALLSAALATGNSKQLAAWWVYRMLTTPAALLEKMTLFWHGHFATSAEKVEDADLMNAQNQLLRKHALGCFPDLLVEISQDPAMLIYLDSASNRKAHPNENYAREIMELFCLGEGNYTEADIRELARCFTGWEVKRQKFRFNRYQHDNESKTVLGQTGKFGGEQAVTIVASQPQAAVFIARKLVRFFVMDEPFATDELVEPLAQQLIENGFIIGPVVQTILTSNLFYSQQAMARKIRSPVEFAIGFASCLNASTNNFTLASRLEELGQGLFYPPSVKGWDGGRTWINSSTLLGRSNLIQELLTSDKSRFNKLPLADFLNNEGITNCDDLIDYFENLLFAIHIPSAAKDRIRKLAQSASQSESFETAIQALCTLPEFQLC